MGILKIVKIPEDEGGGFCASIPLLGEHRYRGDGETVDGAIEDLKENICIDLEAEKGKVQVIEVSSEAPKAEECFHQAHMKMLRQKVMENLE